MYSLAQTLKRNGIEMLLETQQAVITQVRDALGQTVRTVAPWPGAWTETMVKRLGATAPAVYVQFNSAKCSEQSGLWQCDFALLICTHSFAAQRGVVGANEIVMQLVPHLNKAGACTELEMIFNTAQDQQALMVLELSYRLLVSTPTDTDTSQLGDFITFAADYPPAAKDTLTLLQGD